MRVSALACAIFLTSTAPLWADEAPTYDEAMEAAIAAFQAEDWPTVADRLDIAQTYRPYSLFVYRNRILAHYLSGNAEKAKSLAEKAAARGLALNLAGHEGYEAIKASPEFSEIIAQMDENAKPIGEGNIVMEHDDATLLPEAIAFHKGKTFIGGVRNGAIISLDKKGRAKDIAAAQGGVFDIEIRGKDLWAVVNNQLAYEGADPENAFASVMIFNRKSGAPRREIRISEPNALLGDLEVAKNGAAYASDSLTPRLYRLAPDGQSLEIFSADPRYVNLQGLALDEKNNRLFVADYLAGLFVVDTTTGEATPIANEADAHLGGIDGLYLHDGALIGIQNGVAPLRIVRITLDETGTAAAELEVLQQNLGVWNEPTHGAMRGNAFHYIATSNWPSYDREWNVSEENPPQPLRIMAVPLD